VRLLDSDYYLEIFDEPIEMEPDAPEELLNEVIALAGNVCCFQDCRAQLWLSNPNTKLGLLGHLNLRQVQLQEIVQILCQYPCTIKPSSK